MKAITSSQNQLVRTVLRLQQPGGRRGKGRILVEGIKLAGEAVASGVHVERAILAASFAESGAGRSWVGRLEKASVPWVAVPERLFRRLSTLESPEGILLVALQDLLPLQAIEGNLVLVVAGVQDPGNLGALARVGEAAGASALVRCRGSADPLQPKSLRASMGSLFRLPAADGGEAESAVRVLQERGFRVAACHPRDGIDYRRADLGGRLAILLGAEATGLPERLLALSDVRISVPMKAGVESLNVAVVAGLVLYEAARQRGTFGP